MLPQVVNCFTYLSLPQQEVQVLVQEGSCAEGAGGE